MILLPWLESRKRYFKTFAVKAASAVLMIKLKGLGVTRPSGSPHLRE